MRINFTKNS